jgi:hypothetical protein
MIKISNYIKFCFIYMMCQTHPVIAGGYPVHDQANQSINQSQQNELEKQTETLDRLLSTLQTLNRSIGQARSPQIQEQLNRINERIDTIKLEDMAPSHLWSRHKPSSSAALSFDSIPQAKQSLEDLFFTSSSDVTTLTSVRNKRHNAFQDMALQNYAYALLNKQLLSKYPSQLNELMNSTIPANEHQNLMHEVAANTLVLVSIQEQLMHMHGLIGALTQMESARWLLEDDVILRAEEQ